MKNVHRCTFQTRTTGLLLAALALLAAAPLRAAGANLPAPAPATAPLRWNMSPEEVRSASGGRLRPALAGETGDAVLEEFPVGGCRADARLFFGPHGLERIFVPASSCPRLLDTLRSAWGAPDAGRDRPGDVELEWRLPDARARFTHVHLVAPRIDWDRQFLALEPAGRDAP